MQCENVLIHDNGEPFQPITLQLHPSHVTDGIVRLTDLLRCWHPELHRKQSVCTLTDSSIFFHAGSGHVQKLITPVIFTGTVDMPAFHNQGLGCSWMKYQTVAAFAHYGNERANHYQALLRTEPANRGPNASTFWLYCDDCRQPQPCTHIPVGFPEGVTCIWLNRTEVMELHDWQPPVTTPHPSCSGQLLQMFVPPPTRT